MLKKVEDFRSSTQLKSSAVRGLKNLVMEKFEGNEEMVSEMFVAEFPVIENKFKAPHNDISLISVNNTILFIQNSEVTIPHLRVLHRYPGIMKQMQVDRGAIKHVLSGANIMCRGLTSAGGRIVAAEEGEVVSIVGEGKQHAMAIGILRKSSEAIQKENNGIGIELLHYIGDGIWKTKINH